MSQSIINLANAMYSQQPQKESTDRLDAAKALLGVSPHSVADVLLQKHQVASDNSGDEEPTPAPRRDRSDSAGLDALAFLASSESANMEPSAAVRWELSSSKLQDSKPLVASAVSSSSASSDEEAMPPPPPRRTAKRRRSVSNPEGMNRWAPRDRLRFVLPAAILEEELAEASAAMKAKQERRIDDDEDEDNDENTPLNPADDDEEEEEEDESNLSQDELLRRARSRLLEDLSEVNMNGEKGIMKLPHALEKYKEVYNKDGRVGIYTPAERAAIIARYQGKRSRRVWNKKIRYNCRKNLADRRLRVKGRFVKKEEQAKLAAQTPTIPEDDKFVSPESSEVEESDKDAEMPDVSDPDAGFCPTDDQPFRRTRRHTIT
mmetsp:Transcript_111408/g.322083  ORF Transcript_111408/g.322083 Transcript_111408/m.322083 type:complete len:376 (-) Transcript_111408:150-1277(-)